MLLRIGLISMAGGTRRRFLQSRGVYRKHGLAAARLAGAVHFVGAAEGCDFLPLKIKRSRGKLAPTEFWDGFLTHSVSNFLFPMQGTS